MDRPEEGEAEDATLPPEQFIAAVTQSDNIATMLNAGQLNIISQDVMRDYETDRDSMSDWLERMKKGIELATLVKKDKTYPFKGASNVTYPLITSAALQFNARAYPAIVAPDRVVKVKVFGSDPQGLKAARGERIAEHMSFQLTSEIDEWEEETDKLLVQLPIVGTMVRKIWYDPARGRPRCRAVEPGKFIVNNKVKVLTDAPRCTEELPLYPVEIQERINAGLFLDIDLDEEDESKQELQDFIEQHCRLDLDEDDYPEPYIVTVHCKTRKVVRIVADFEASDVRYETEQSVEMVPAQSMAPDGTYFETLEPQQTEVVTGIKSIRRGSYFVPYHFLPSLDGGFFGTGLGLLLSDISKSINTILNMLIDAGHYASLGGGWIGSEFRTKGGPQTFRPGEYKLAQVGGGDIRQSIVDRTFPGPDAVLFQMLGTLIEAGKELSSTKDIMTGDSGGKVQTATTTVALIEQGLALFSAVYKRVFRSLRGEFKLLAKINSYTVDAERYNAFHDDEMQYDPAQEYSDADMDVQPVADPRSVTRMQAMATAQMLMEMAGQGLVDAREAASRILEAAGVEDTEDLLPKPDPMQEQMAQMQMQAMQADLADKMANIQLTLAKVEETRASAVENMANAQSDAAKVQIEQFRAQLDAVKAMLEDQRDRMAASLGRGRGGMAGASGDGGSQGGGRQGAGADPSQSFASLSLGQGGAGILPGGGNAGFPMG